MTTSPVRDVAVGLPRWTPVAGGAAMTLVLAGALWASGHLDSDPVLHDVALFGHLASLVLGFGAVLAVDWVGLLWVLGRRDLSDVLRTAADAHLPIWVGYAGLVATGVLLEPDLDSVATRAKLVLVLAVGWNGVAATTLRAPLAAAPLGRSRALLVRSLVSVAVSQVGWWGAMAVGFLNAR